MKKNTVRKRNSSHRAIRWRISALALGFWLLCAVLLTWAAAMDVYRQLEFNATKYATAWAGSEYYTTEANREAPGYADYCRLSNISDLGWNTLLITPRFPIKTSSHTIISHKDALPVQCALSYHYDDGHRLVELTSAGSYAYFSYITPEKWNAEEKPEPVDGYLYIDCDKLDETFGETEPRAFYGAPLELNGWFEGNEFHPVKVRSGSNTDWGRRDRTRWKTIYEAPMPSDQQIVTLYAPTPYQSFAFLHSPAPVTVDGKEYERLEDILPTLAKESSLTNAVVRGYGVYTDRDGNTVSVRVALQANPLGYVMGQLRWVYLISLTLTIVAVYLILRRIRKNLTEPVAKVADHFRNGMQPLEEETAPKWAEALALQQHYDAVATAYHDAQTNAIRLQAALDYAQNAEAHRRKMISGITHELKTPLAVIHSYAEGLRDGIAADKQEQYLNVILDEAERMDAMVLQMLDLSRLEAGRVRLVTEPFSLLALTRSILERLQPLADDKQLRIHYVIAEEFSITADKERMEQVITNFATNAIKYTPDGGSIWLKLYRHQGKTYFVLTNECEPLPADALQQVWDSFYRVEEARSAKGTGLGLSIARAIIELHGGTVQAANTSDGVEFQFTLP